MIRLLKNIWKIEDEKHFKWVKFARFIISGGTATTLNIFSLYFLVHFLYFWYLLAAIFAYSLAFGVSFVLQKFWTFRNTSKENIHIQFVFFLFAGLAGLVLNTTLIFVLVEYAHLHYLLAQVLCGLLIAFLNYFLYKEFVFHKEKTEKIFLFLDKHKTKLVFVSIFVLFLVLRLPGISLPYHQDEMKTALISYNGAEKASGFSHPPLTQLLYRAENLLLGPDYFRVFILIFSIVGAFLTFFVVNRRLGHSYALFSIFLLSLGAYSVHSSLMLDTDGAILPLFFLASVYFYDRVLEVSSKKKQLFLGLMLLFLIIGFLVKLSFIIVVGTIVCDFLYRERKRMTKRFVIISTASLFGFLLTFVVAIFAIKIFYPVFSIEGMISHAKSYINFGQRGWSQIIIQGVKAIFYLSPILIILPFFIIRPIFEKIRIFFIYLTLGFVFYFILFDFSQGALDKYLMFSIVPLSIIGGTVATSIFKEKKEAKKTAGIIIGILGSLLIIFLAFLPHNVLPLHPKNLFTSSVFNLKWDILFPFTGGSGPLGFYMSFLFIAFSFILSGICGIVAFFKNEWRYSCLIALLFISFTYNAVFVEEFLFGRLYGSAPTVLKESLLFIENSPDIKEIITYNDTGGYELYKMNKYKDRFYAVPGYEEGHKKKFAKYNGHYLVVDMPKINEGSFYGQFFAKCTSIFEAKSGKIIGNVYNCSI